LATEKKKRRSYLAEKKTRIQKEKGGEGEKKRGKRYFNHGGDEKKLSPIDERKRFHLPGREEKRGGPASVSSDPIFIKGGIPILAVISQGGRLLPR